MFASSHKRAEETTTEKNTAVSELVCDCGSIYPLNIWRIFLGARLNKQWLYRVIQTCLERVLQFNLHFRRKNQISGASVYKFILSVGMKCCEMFVAWLCHGDMRRMLECGSKYS